MASKKNGTIHTAVANNLRRRIYEHKSKSVPGFTSWYDVNKLVYFEDNNDIRLAIAREKQIKGWLRRKKIALIESTNPQWMDLSEAWNE